MKTKMLKLFTILFFLLGYTLASAQDYVVTLKGDTLRGNVRYSNNATAKSVRITTTTGQKSNYTILQVKSFMVDNQVYHTVKMVYGYTFMKLISSGYLNLYNYQSENQTNWDGRFFTKRDGTSLDVPNIGFKKRVAEFLADCLEVSAKVESGVLDKNNLTKIVTEYNACVDQRTNQTVKKTSENGAWKSLEIAVEALPAFSKKSDALEMIREIQAKISQNESIPSFLANGLKDALKDQPTVTEKLDLAFQKMN